MQVDRDWFFGLFSELWAQANVHTHLEKVAAGLTGLADVLVHPTCIFWHLQSTDNARLYLVNLSTYPPFYIPTYTEGR